MKPADNLNAIWALEADSIDVLDENSIDAIKRGVNCSQDPVTLRYQSWEARDLFNQRYQMLSRQRKIISASANDSVSSTYFTDLKDSSLQRKVLLSNTSIIKKETDSNDLEITPIKSKFSLSHPSNGDSGDRKDGNYSPEMNLSPDGMKLEKRNEQVLQRFGLLSASRFRKKDVPIFNIRDIATGNRNFIQKFGIRSASKRRKERQVGGALDESKQFPDEYPISSAFDQEGEDESVSDIIYLKEDSGSDQQEMSPLSPPKLDSGNKLNYKEFSNLSATSFPCIGKNNPVEQNVERFSPTENISVESYGSDVSDLEEDHDDRFNRQRARSAEFPSIDKGSQPRKESSRLRNKKDRLSRSSDSIIPEPFLRSVSELTFATHTEITTSQVLKTSLHVNLDIAIKAGSALSYSDGMIVDDDASSVITFQTAEDSYISELAEKDYDASSIAEPLSARSRFISLCIREGLNPRASIVLRKNMSTHLNLSHLSMGNKIAMILAECLPDLPDVESIDISHNNLTDNGLECVIKAVSTITSLMKLNVSSNIIDPKAAMAISSYLSSPDCPLKSFIIQNADVDDHECAQFIKSILENSTLTEIDLSANKIGSAESLNTVKPDFITGGESIATLLRSPKTKLGKDSNFSLSVLIRCGFTRQ